MLSAFGVEHGDQISKAQDRYGGHGAPTTGRRATAYLAGPFHSAVAGKPGRKLRATGNQLGGTIGGALGGQMAGAGIGALTRRPSVMQGLAGLGGMAGGVTGGQLAVNRNQRMGNYKKQRKGAF